MPADVVYLANLNTYDAFFDLVVKIKKKCHDQEHRRGFPETPGVGPDRPGADDENGGN